MECLIESVRDLYGPAKTEKVCVFGQGFVGLPLALSYALQGHRVIGVDIDERLVHHLNSADTLLKEEFRNVSIRELLAESLQSGLYKATTNAAAAVKECNNIIVTVGLPVLNGTPFSGHLEKACRVIGQYLKPGDLVLVRSTVVPGTTEDFVAPILEEESGMSAGIDFYLAYSPERIAEGNAFEEIGQMKTLVAGVNDASVERAARLLSDVCKADIIGASTIKAAETAKVFENVHRDANIAIAQEMARFSEKMGIDIFEVIRLANTHSRVNILTPGPGVGGYCIPNAFHYLAAADCNMDQDLEILRQCRKKNADIPRFLLSKLAGLLLYCGRNITHCKIAVLGLAMKDYSNDDRISPAVELCDLIQRTGAEIRAFDPAVSTPYPFKVSTQEEALKNADGVLILTRQQGMVLDDCGLFAQLMRPKPVCIDAKGIVAKTDAEKYGFIYWRI